MLLKPKSKLDKIFNTNSKTGLGLSVFTAVVTAMSSGLQYSRGNKAVAVALGIVTIFSAAAAIGYNNAVVDQEKSLKKKEDNKLDI